MMSWRKLFVPISLCTHVTLGLFGFIAIQSALRHIYVKEDATRSFGSNILSSVYWIQDVNEPSTNEDKPDSALQDELYEPDTSLKGGIPSGGVASLRDTPNEAESDQESKYSDIPGSASLTLHSISDEVDLEEKIDTFTMDPIPFESNYRNPCWYEMVNITDAYVDNFYAHSQQHSTYQENFRGMKQMLYERLGDMRGNQPNQTWMLRCLPYFYLVGVSRCGTTDLAMGISHHPHVLAGLEKELKYWNRIRIRHSGMEYNPYFADKQNVNSKLTQYPRSLKTYLEAFDDQAERIRKSWIERNGSQYHRLVLGDYTPSYLWDFDGWRNLPQNAGLLEPKRTVADYIQMTTPDAKLVVILRNPVDRLYSDFNKFPVQGKRTRALFHELSHRGLQSFEACAKTNTIRGCAYNYTTDMQSKPVRVRVGIYFPFIDEWIAKFSGQILITTLESYSAGRSEVLKEVFKFLELDPINARMLRRVENEPIRNTGEANVKSKIAPMWKVTRNMLEDFYRPWNKQLEHLLNDSQFHWF